MLGSFSLGNLAAIANDFILEKFGWFYSLLMTAIVLLAIYLAFSKYGKIKLGKDDDKPEFSFISWLAMLFGAGMGIGLVFYGISEPFSHVQSPLTENPGSDDSIRFAMRYSFFHWGIHPWALYAVGALTIAYFTYRKGYSGTISSTVTPLFKASSSSPLGRIIDILSVIAIVFGIVPTIGIGAQQIAGGLSYLLPQVENTTTLQIVLIAIFTVLFLVSAQTGLKRGIKYLSNINITLALIILLFVLFFGPTLFILNFFTSNIGSYIQNLPEMSLRLNPLNEEGAQYIRNWTIFYWGWWISWTPFVASFIARISKGRTIRGFIFGVVLVPSLISVFWFSVLGGGSLHIDLFQGGEIASQIASNGQEIGLFALFSNLPLTELMTFIGISLIATFFITSADSATFVIASQTSGGSLTPPSRLKMIWGITISLLAIILLKTGGLSALQTAALVGALPFSFVLILMLISLMKALNDEVR